MGSDQRVERHEHQADGEIEQDGADHAVVGDAAGSEHPDQHSGDALGRSALGYDFPEHRADANDRQERSERGAEPKLERQQHFRERAAVTGQRESAPHNHHARNG